MKFSFNFQCIFASVPTGVASIELASRTDTSLSITWAEPQNTDLARYDVSISPNDGAENLPISVNKYVEYLPRFKKVQNPHDGYIIRSLIFSRLLLSLFQGPYIIVRFQ